MDQNTQSDEDHTSENVTNAEIKQEQAFPVVIDDIKEYKLFAILGYLLPFLFFIPMLNDKSKHVPYVRFHANQQLTLLVIWVAVSIVSNMLFTILYVFMPFVNIAMLVFVVLGIISAAQGTMKKMPLLGDIALLSKIF